MPPPSRIVSLLPAATEMLFALGIGDRVVGVSHECDFPPEANRLPRVSRSCVDPSLTSEQIDVRVKELLGAGEPLYELDQELFFGLRPDLVVTQHHCAVCAIDDQMIRRLIDQHSQLGGVSVVSLSPHSLTDVLGDIRQLAAATHSEAAATRLLGELQGRMENVDRVTRGIARPQRPRTACIEWVEPLMLAGNWTPEIIELAGGVSLLAHANTASAYVAWDDLVRAQPEIILVIPCGFGVARAVVESRPLLRRAGWQDLPAVRCGRVYALDGNALFHRPGPRLVDSLEWLAHLLHPSLFASPVGAQSPPPFLPIA